MSKQFSAIYPGSFDPVTNGHLDIIDRSRSKFDLVIVAVLVNLDKKPFFATEERVEMLRNATEKWDNVEVDTFEGLLVNYAREKEAQVILRAIRAVTDYEYEFQMALMNRRMEPDVETIFMVPAEKYSYLSSRLVKEIALLGGDVSGLVPPAVEGSLKKKTRSV
ncbi:MAG: pantetheine-phosphate adenylyltransferase [Acidobacteriota bacterium]|nr:pantetheine-phosphate adenylyltransferase [Acidobacteriota bacterium]